MWCMIGGGEIRLEPVVILLRDGLELEIVAPGTADRQPEEGRTEDIGALGRDSLRLRAMSGLPALRRTGPRR